MKSIVLFTKHYEKDEIHSTCGMRGGHLGMNGRIIIKSMLKAQDVTIPNRVNRHRTDFVAAFYEHDNGISAFIKTGNK
jgi:hypothetical protein